MIFGCISSLFYVKKPRYSNKAKTSNGMCLDLNLLEFILFRIYLK